MSDEDFARAEAMLIAEEEAARRVESGEEIVLPVEAVKLESFPGSRGDIYKFIPHNVAFTLHYADSVKFSLLVGDNDVDKEIIMLKLSSFYTPCYIKVKVNASNLWSGDIFGGSVEEGTLTSAYAIFDRLQPSGTFVAVSAEEFQIAIDRQLDAEAAVTIAEFEEKKKLELEEAVEPESVKEKAYAKWSELLEAIYPGNWEINSDDLLIIKFDQFTITNSINLSHIVRDLYVKWELTEDLAPKGNICGFRGLRTIEEFESGYIHSHLRTGKHRNWEDNDFCLGEGRFGELIYGLSSGREHDWQEINEALIMLDIYVSWESLEGGPYMKIGDVVRNASSSRTNRPSLNSESLDRLYNAWMRRKPELDFATIQEGSRGSLFVVDLEAIGRNIVSTVEQAYGETYTDVIMLDGSIAPLFTVLGTGDAVTPRLIEQYNRELAEAAEDCPEEYYYKGERIIPKIYCPEVEEVEEVKKEQLSLTVTYFLKAYFQERLERELNEYAIKIHKP